ncbi:hypothetical protein BKA70DRAFT_1218105 [Coprinopsis sp. MPI-PUGE-AT-0042]|nr:hypothetical protein BKA70DRAFT_1218105 [Coprinopsis sp. MPI-PUGE-AT-0042]
MSFSQSTNAFVCKECNAQYRSARHLDAHERNHCRSAKRGLSRLLGQAKERWQGRKRRRIESMLDLPQAHPPPTSSSEHDAPTGGLVEGGSEIDDSPHPQATSTPPMVIDSPPVDLDAPISQRKSARNRRMPSRYRDDAGLPSDIDDEDVYPEPLAALEPVEESSVEEMDSPSTEEASSSASNGIARWWKSKCNKFSLWRRYHGIAPPARDPEQYLELEDFDDSVPPDSTPIQTSQASSVEPPIPNLDAGSAHPGHGELQSKATRIACIKQNGHHPCTACLVVQSDVHNMGTEEDMAFRTGNPRVNDEENREMIRKALQTTSNGYAVTGSAVNVHLQERSLLPVDTYELPGEVQARGRRELRRRSTATRPPQGESSGKANKLKSQREKKFSLATPKYHALGHYVSQIRRFGTVDSFTSEIRSIQGETNHPAVKTWFKRTDRRNFPSQIAGVERQRARLRNLKARYNRDHKTGHLPPPQEEETAGLSGPEESQHRIGGGVRYHDMHTTFGPNPTGLEDPAVDNFVPKLKYFLLPQIQRLLAPELYGLDHQLTPPEQKLEEWRSVDLDKNRIYCLETMSIKYTTYDVRRQEDTLRVKSESNIMVLDTRGERLEFEPLHSSGAFGFLDPGEVIRGVHLIPQLSLKPQPLKSQTSKWMGGKKKWRFYYVNRYADRDMYMRYHLKFAIGHCAIRKRCRRDGLTITTDTVPPHDLFPPLDANGEPEGDWDEMEEEESSQSNGSGDDERESSGSEDDEREMDGSEDDGWENDGSEDDEWESDEPDDDEGDEGSDSGQEGSDLD